MDLWNNFFHEKMEFGFGTRQLLLNTGDRHNSSLKRYFDRSIELNNDSFIKKSYSYEQRYIQVKNITFDIFVLFFDVNTSYSIAFRSSSILEDKKIDTLSKLIKKLKLSKIEARIIGLQNGHTDLSTFLNYMYDCIDCTLLEADIFGKEVRNILIDTKTGMSYNLLLENRIYRPGELINKQSFEEFQTQKKKLVIQE